MHTSLHNVCVASAMEYLALKWSESFALHLLPNLIFANSLLLHFFNNQEYIRRDMATHKIEMRRNIKDILCNKVCHSWMTHIIITILALHSLHVQFLLHDYVVKHDVLRTCNYNEFHCEVNVLYKLCPARSLHDLCKISMNGKLCR